MTEDWGKKFQFILLVQLWATLKKCLRDATWNWDFVCKNSKEKIHSHKIFLVSLSWPKFPVMDPLKLHRVYKVIIDYFRSQTQSSLYFPSLMPIFSNTQFIKMEWCEIFQTIHLNFYWLDKHKLWMILLRNGEILPLTFGVLKYQISFSYNPQVSIIFTEEFNTKKLSCSEKQILPHKSITPQ